MVLEELSSEQIETLRLIREIAENGRFSPKDLRKHKLQHLSYMAVWLRIRTLMEKGFVDRVEKGTYIITQKGLQALEELEELKEDATGARG